MTKTTYVVNRSYSKTGLEVTITARDVNANKEIPCVLKGNLLANPYAPAQRSTGTVTNFTYAINFNTAEDPTLMGTIIEAVAEVCNFHGIQTPTFEHFIPVSQGAWGNDSDRAQNELQTGTFIEARGAVKVRAYKNKLGVWKLDIHLGNFATYRVLAKGKAQVTESDFTVAEDVYPFAI